MTQPYTMQELTPFEQHIAAILESVYNTPASASKTEAGLGSLNGAVTSRDTCNSERGIFSSEPDTYARPNIGACRQFGGPDGGAVKLAGAPSVFLPRSGCLPLGSGKAAMQTVTGARAMSQNQTTGTTVAIATPDLDIIDGQITTTSNQVAANFGKLHKNVLRAIERLECSQEFNRLNFELAEFEDAKGEKRPAYRMTRDGFTFLAMGFTGKNAAQWKEAYISAFNKMEAELLKQQAPTQRPYNPALDYDRISPAQAQDIKELVHMVVESGVQGFPDTWGRLHKKFRVNSYLELPATRYEEVCSYLRAKFPKAYRLKDAELPFAVAEDDSIDVAALLLSGQSDPKPLTPAVQALIDQHTGRLMGEAYPLIRAHLERRVAWNTNAAQQNDTGATQAILDNATLGNCLVHHYRAELQAAQMLMQVVRQRLDMALGSISHPLGLAH